MKNKKTIFLFIAVFLSFVGLFLEITGSGPMGWRKILPFSWKMKVYETFPLPLMMLLEISLHLLWAEIVLVFIYAALFSSRKKSLKVKKSTAIIMLAVLFVFSNIMSGLFVYMWQQKELKEIF